MYDQRALVTGNWDNIVAMVRAMFVAGLCRVEHISREQYETVQIVLGDDSEVRAYYARMTAEREALRERAIVASAAGNSGLASRLFHEASELLIRYQERSGSVREKPYTISTNIYGWAMGSIFLSNLYGGPFAVTVRGATLEYCIRVGCNDASAQKGTTLTMNVIGLDTDTEKLVDLVLAAGGDENAVAWVRGEPARKAERDAKAAERQAQFAAERAVQAAFADEQAAIVEAARAAIAADKTCRVEKRTNGLIVRGKAYNPSLQCIVSPTGFSIVRTDFDGVRKEHATVAASSERPTVTEVTTALQEAWTAMKAAS